MEPMLLPKGICLENEQFNPINPLLNKNVYIAPTYPWERFFLDKGIKLIEPPLQQLKIAVGFPGLN